MSQEQTVDLEALYKHIEETNAAFLAMSPPEKRVQLAKDALHQLAIGRLLPFSAYLKAVGDGYAIGRRQDQEELQTLLKRTPVCEVCGIGALFVAAVDRLNALKVYDFSSMALRPDIHHYLEKHGLFSGAELMIVENYFEGPESMLGKRARMEAIMTTIINREGATITRENLMVTEYAIMAKM